MQTLTLILTAIVLIQNFILRSQLEKLKKKVSDLHIPYEHYSHLQKAYVNYYKWLAQLSTDKTNQSILTFKLCLRKFEKLFNQE